MKTCLLLPALAASLALPLFAQDEEAAAPKTEAAAVQKVALASKPGGVMKFEQTELKVKAGVPVELNYNNPDVLQHNVLILKPGTKEKVGALADALLLNPKAMEMAFIPKSSDILHHTKLVNPGQSAVLKFTIKEPGTYPIICTFPGHWRLMFADLVVEK
jgi:uncharacterized cupredoxin-like copper-binding protein